jgi:chromosome segregation ATPase
LPRGRKSERAREIRGIFKYTTERCKRQPRMEECASRERERKLIITNINISCAHEHRQANDAGEIKASERMDGWMDVRELIDVG